MLRITREFLLVPIFALTVVASCDDTATTLGPSDAEATRASAFPPGPDGREQQFTQSFRFEDCRFATEGRNPFFILEPGYTQVFEDGDGGQLAITVLAETERVGGIVTRVVEERETEDGALVELSRNFFAICAPNNSVFYFGESVDNYEDGVLVDHDGSWRHGTDRARAGVIMPGIALLGARYFQEIAPGVALDRAEIVAVEETMRTPYGRHVGVLVTRETTPLEPDVVELKYYAPGIGLLQDGDLRLVSVSSGGSRR